MSLQDEIDQRRKQIKSDGYPISIGELAGMFEHNELDINPEFQRWYRWSPDQQTKLIESVLLGIPIPPIFVSQRDDGVWDVIDGQQRLSTIFQFMGVYREPTEYQNENEDDDLPPREPFNTLSATAFLPSLGGKKWNDPNDIAHSFTAAQRLEFKREKLDVKIIKRESTADTKFEMFQRLNSLGSRLSDQELRNCVLVMVDRDFYLWLRKLSKHPSFRSTISLSDRLVREQYHMELVLRFLILKSTPDTVLRRIGDISEFLSDQMLQLPRAIGDMAAEEDKFKRTFDVLARVESDNVFRKFEAGSQRFRGPFLNSAFEVVAVGVGANIDYWGVENITPAQEITLSNLIRDIWNHNAVTNNSGMGVRASTRIPALVPFGKRHFRHAQAVN